MYFLEEKKQFKSNNHLVQLSSEHDTIKQSPSVVINTLVPTAKQVDNSDSATHVFSPRLSIAN